MSHPVRAASRFNVSRERAFDVFADPAQMSRFWFHRRDHGMRAGENIRFYLGSAEDAISFEVRVFELTRPSCLAFEWGDGDDRATVRFTFEERGTDASLVRIEESGHVVGGDALLARLLDSTGGFNQVIIAARAFAEHGVSVNVVEGHE